MPITIINPCADDIIDPECDPCLGGVEHGRVRGAGYINKAYISTVQDAIDDLVAAQKAIPLVPANVTAAKAILDTAIADGITGKVIYIIPETTGTFDGGSPVEGPGYGDRTSRFIGFNFGLAYKDPSFAANTDFYNTISRSTGWMFFWRTETLTRISNNPVTIIHKSPVQEDLNSEVVWEIEIKWTGKTQPKPYNDMVEYFVCPN
jgi:hypothetical protein